MSIWTRILGLEKNPEYELGIRYFNEGEYELAVRELEKAIEKLGPSDPQYALGMFYAAESHVHIGTTLFHTGDLDGAFEHFRIAVRENPTYPDLYYRMGVIFHNRGQLDDSVGMLQRAIELNDGYFEAVCYLGIVLFEKGEKDEADEIFNRALKLGADNPTPVSKFLSEHMASRETDIPPLASIREYVKSDTEFEICLKDGIEAFNTCDYNLAIAAFTEASRLHPDYADIHFKLGLSLLREGLSAKAREELELALGINGDYTEARYYLGVAFLSDRMFKEALPHFERAAREKPGYADLQCHLGATLFYLGEHQRARSVLERTLELSPSYSRAKYYYGLLLYDTGEKARAVELLTEGVRGSDKPANADLSVALVHLREENLEESMSVLKEILAAGSDSADVLYFIGEVYLRMGNTDNAEEFFRRSLKINDRFLRAREKLAMILIRREEYQEAEELLASNGDRFADLYKIMGDIQFFKGHLEDAEGYYRKSLDVNAEYGEAMISLALTLRKKGDSAGADGLLKRLLEIDPENLAARNLVGEGSAGIGSQ
ncbi:MAG TPA: tetratricopeptide repeat protein [Candidatus Krumholzibacterium sp.]|nr:tetratricopeptide repeat protein [Candidatus Krumholzibacterium sp.]